MSAQPQSLYECGHLLFCIDCQRSAGEWLNICPICKKEGPTYEKVHLTRRLFNNR
ncbi:unnamed protein product [Meloidogyne enterolobii]|uniref:Uncharacterized protein n=1 Tax=Meloidogyne enterolobii TaxID=390850 RepID=A0ACB1AB17_MELEN